MALDKMVDLSLLTIRNQRTRRGSTRQIQGIPPQAVKLAIALSDTSYPVINTAVEKYIDEFIVTGGDYAKFVSLLEISSGKLSVVEKGLRLIEGIK